MDLQPSHRGIIPAALIGVAAVLFAGCADERSAAVPAAPPRSLAAPEPVDPAVMAALLADPRCRCIFDADAATRSPESLGGELRFSLDPDTSLGVRIPAISTVLHLRATTVSVLFEHTPGGGGGPAGPPKVRALRLWGSPALITDAAGHPMAVSSGITLGLDESGVSTIDIEPGGTILQIPGA
jgi:hypothetical protein